jgi:small subunit ribosomal protein S5
VKISGISSNLRSNESITKEPTTTTMATKSQQFSWSRVLLHHQALRRPTKHPLYYSRKIPTFPHFPTSQTPYFSFLTKTHYSTASNRVAQDLLAEVERERQRERQQRKRSGLDTKDIDAEDEEDYMGVAPLIEKLEKEKLKDTGDLNQYEERTDSDSDDDDERFSGDAMKKRRDEFERKFKRHEEFLKNFTEAGMKCGPVCLDGLSFGY